ncbi:hypothetical protein [Pseudomonas sp. CGJS7]|uniref:hypothetical protein n=1 Tax=Pseudomonas sp. CGJS7 TaxID=3109348 RepID=UPI00300A28DE
MEDPTTASISPGDVYEDAFCHPCLCFGIDDAGFVWGVSLIDGSYPRTTDPHGSGIRRLTIEQAWEWKQRGPESMAQAWKTEHGLED